jgi:transglutaminase-like putative cysteine protease
MPTRPRRFSTDAPGPVIHTPAGSWPIPGPEYLAGGRFIDSGHPAVCRFAGEVTAGARSDVEKAVALFYRVRDGWRYDPFCLRLTAEHHKASNVLSERSAYCVTKAILLSALARASGIPSALGLADVENHLSTGRLKERMGGRTLFLHHGYALLHLDGQWVRAAPVFNIELCRRFGVRPVEFDGRGDAVLQEYDARNRHHMEYRRDHGYFSDFPIERVFADLRAAYPPTLFQDDPDSARFEDDVSPP